MKLIQALVLLSVFIIHAQKKQAYRIRTIAFYNVENLFDTINNPDTFDDNRTPKGSYRWTKKRYADKIDKIAQIISEIGADKRNDTPDVIGLAEVENHAVLSDLIQNRHLRNEGYQIIHKDSRDNRGIDVALLIKKGVFTLTTLKTYPLKLLNEKGYTYFSRDILVVSGFFEGEIIYFIVNHWPSRRGGVLKSKPKRIAAARLNKKIIDSIRRKDHMAKIISMGDFNDDPNSYSFKTILKTKYNIKKLTETDLYNPMRQMAKKGIGSLAYKDNWNLFDQFFFTSSLFTNQGYHFWKVGVYNKLHLQTSRGKYKGYPLRSYAGGTYTGGYSDHFPVYMYILKAVTKI